MVNVVFVAPFLLDATIRFIGAAARLPGVRLVVVSQDPSSRLPQGVRQSVHAYEQVSDALHTDALVRTIRMVQGKVGSVDRLLGALEELQVPLGHVRSELNITGMNGTTAEKFRDKALMKQILQDAGLPCARHRRVRTGSEVRAFVDEIGLPVIAKPTAGSGSRDTFRIETPDQLDEYVQRLEQSPSSETMLEEFIVGDEFSFDSVFVNGRLAWYSINHYYPSPLEVLENSWIQWCVLLPRERANPLYEGIVQVAEPTLRTLGMHFGLSHMEWFRRRDGSVAISEVGARPPGAQFTTLISYAHNVNFYDRWARLMIFDSFTPPARPFAAGAVFLRAPTQGRIRRVVGLDEANRSFGELAVEVHLPKAGSRTASGYDGDGFVIVRHPKTEVVKNALRSIVSTVRVEAS